MYVIVYYKIIHTVHIKEKKLVNTHKRKKHNANWKKSLTINMYTENQKDYQKINLNMWEQVQSIKSTHDKK